ncbi:hypothetical protein EJ08DRAFT_652303 [Tothia fuscella]|uniref:Uncharacterized protein n=1 Tax=Tothia fuscella TaxID=1048955 RepID=A0A9P4NK76_9PEZI|nr:hypothetical protein EJ08DRAFT_652303 [Tothia fuscella]
MVTSYLPTELKALVINNRNLDDPTDVQALLNLRATNHDFCELLQGPFEKLFQKCTVMLHPRSLDVLAAIGQHERLREAVHEIAFSIRVSAIGSNSTILTININSDM